jgi:hypothetical protein
MEAADAVIIACGLSWGGAYALIIWHGHRDRTFGMPWLALAVNVAWELLYTAVADYGFPGRQVALVWFTLDMAIVYQFLVHAPPEWREYSLGSRAARFAGVVGVAFVLVTAVEIEFGDLAYIYSGYAENILMSVLFIRMLGARNSTAGQSMGIALAKLLGSFLGFVLAWVWYPFSPLVCALYAVVLPLDIVYAVRLRRAFLAEGRNPWTRRLLVSRPEAGGITA